MDRKVSALNRKEIFTMPAGTYFDGAAESVYLVYSPLAGEVALATGEQVDALEEALGEPEKKSESNDILRQFLAYTHPSQKSKIVKSPAEYTKLSILPNYTCNFHCSYCYSAGGRSKQSLERRQLQSMLDYFIDPARVRTRHLTIFISGGGEPLLSWEVVRFGIEYARERAGRYGFTLDILLMTNGSVMNTGIIRVLQEQQVNVGVSFEVLEEVQNRQRGKYTLVASNIRKLIAEGIVPSVSSTITPLNVALQERMAEEMIRTFPEIRHLNFDPAMDDRAFESGKVLQAFYAEFEYHFFNARKICQAEGKTLDCNVVRKLEGIFERYCPGKLCLTPQGTVSICHTVSSPLEEMYGKCCYGEIGDSGRLMIDQAKFEALVGDNVYNKEKCRTCFAKWHCGGGCLMYRNHYNEEKMEAVCQFTCRMIRELLLQRLENEYRKNDLNLKEEIKTLLRIEPNRKL